MTEGTRSGEPVPIFTARDNSSLYLDSKALERILLADHLKDKPVVVISVAGAFRTGKSFLLNFFVRYLRSQCRNDWLKQPDEPLHGIRWRGDPQQDTVGILVWSEVFLVTTPEDRELAVVLMDTQGTFDSVSTTDECMTFFALSTMLSSVQIYNISQCIQDNYLQHLQLFCDYARLAQKDVKGTPFQKLVLLVRDWSRLFEAQYGIQGRYSTLHRWLQSSEDPTNDMKGLRQDINHYFQDITCFLMPQPGYKVTTKPDFEGRLCDIDDAFKEQLETLVPLILAPERLTTKTINHIEITCEELKKVFEVYSAEFQRGSLLSPTSLREATGVENNLEAIKNALRHYESEMNELCSGGYLSHDEFFEGHETRRASALNVFDRKGNLGRKDLAEHYRKMLVQEIESKYDEYRMRNLMNKRPDCTLL